MSLKSIIFLLCINLLSTLSLYPQQTTHSHTITIFVHGTFSFRKVVQYTPFRSMIYCKPGLHLAKELPKNYFFHQIALHCAQQNPANYNLDQFYIFGWKSEHIYNISRKLAAEDLVQELKKLVNGYYQKHKIIPQIQLIGFSHGGNVILHTAAYLPLIINDINVQIVIWLFGTPVQNINKHLINSPHFTKAYAVYSSKDWMQRMDPQGLRKFAFNFKNFWSDRMFNTTDKCIQASLTVNNKPIAHSYYRYIFKHLAKIQQLIKEQATNTNNKHLNINLTL